MEQVKLGSSELKVSRMGLGTMGMSEFYGETNEAQSISTIHAAIDHGLNFLDTADMYGTGHNEELLNRALKGRWHEVVLATKFGILRDGDEFLGLNGKAEYVKQACEASLNRLGTDVIDLYYLHRKDPNTPIEETVGAMAELVKEGKVRYLGLSEVGGETLKKAAAIHPIVAVQSEYSLWSRDIEETSVPVLAETGTSLVAYSPLGRGFLTGKYKSPDDFADNDYRKYNPRFLGEAFNANLKVVEAVEQLAAEKGATSGQIALAWIMAKGEHFIPLFGTKREKYLLENIGAMEVTLTAEEVTALDKLSEIVMGTRYDERGMAIVNA